MHSTLLFLFSGLCGGWLGLFTGLPGWGPRLAAVVQAAHAAAPMTFESRLVVYVSGAVRRPGLYRLQAGARVVDAIQMAGGAQKEADLMALDLAAELEDGQSIQVPGQVGARQNQSPGSASAHGKRLDAEGGLRLLRANPPSRASKGPAAKTRRHLLNLNRAGASELQRLPGVGPGLAAKILAQRRRIGQFRRLEDLREIGGIGEKRLAKIAPHVVL